MHDRPNKSFKLSNSAKIWHNLILNKKNDRKLCHRCITLRHLTTQNPTETN